MYILFLLISFGASIIGAVCGIGGGVIVKPILDASGVLNVAAISFLSGCTVLAMSLYSVVSTWIKKETKINLRISATLSVGAAIGGVVGKQVFSSIWFVFKNKNTPGLIQAACLIILTIGTLVYMLKRCDIKTHKIKNMGAILLVGFVLGLFSSFLGIGGGPINLVVLFFFFSMDTKEAAENSLFIILFSQITSLFTTTITKTIPEVDIVILSLMILGGVLGGIMGKKVNKLIKSEAVDKLFIILMLIIILVNIYNIFKYSA